MPESLHRQLVMEANKRFWDQTGYKRGQRLEQSNAADRAKMPIWMAIYQDVLREHAAGQIVPPPRVTPPREVAPPPPPRAAPARPPLLTQSPSSPATVPTEAVMDDGRGIRPGKALLAVGGLFVVGAVLKAIYNEIGVYRDVGELEQSSQRRRRSSLVTP